MNTISRPCLSATPRKCGRELWYPRSDVVEPPLRRQNWIEGIFNGTHGSYWDKDGNLYVQDWNVDGRIMKLDRVR